MLELLQSVEECWKTYGTDAVSMVLYWLAIAWFFLCRRERKKENLYLYAVLAALFVAGGQIVFVMLDRMPTQKLFYLLPVAMLVAYAGVEVADGAFSAKKKWIIVALYVIIIQAGTGWRFTDAYAFANYNSAKVSSTVVQMAELIEGVGEIDEPFLYAPDGIASQIQEYDVHIKVAYGEGYQYAESDREGLLAAMDDYGCNFIVIVHAYDDEDEMKARGYRQVSIFDGYSLYYKTEGKEVEK